MCVVVFKMCVECYVDVLGWYGGVIVWYCGDWFYEDVVCVGVDVEKD